MANLVIAVIAVAFAAALSLAGVNYMSQTASVAHSESVNNSTQIDSLLADYQSLRQQIGHRPTAADYQATYTSRTASTAYNYSSGQVTTPSRVDGISGNWTYLPGCAGGTQDCFYMQVSNITPTIYRALQVSALQQMSDGSNSRLVFSTSAADDPNAITNPNGWPTTPPATPFWVTVRVTSGNVTSVAPAPVYTYSETPVYGAAPPACTASDPEELQSYTCTRSDGTNIPTSITNPALPYCPVPALQVDVPNYLNCTYYTSQFESWNACTDGTQTCNWSCYASNNGSRTLEPQSACNGPPPGCGPVPCGQTAPPPTNPTGFAYITVAPIIYSTCQPITNYCGQGVETATSWGCIRSDTGASVDESNCTQPASVQCLNYQYCTPQNVVYGTCDKNCASGTCPAQTCGAGTASNPTWTCGDNQGHTTSNSNCTPPPATETCTDYSGCTYALFDVQYGGCEPACGTSQEAVQAQCQRSDGTFAVNVDGTPALNLCPPIPVKTCTDLSLCGGANGVAGQYVCPAGCGPESAPLTPGSCKDNNGNPLPDGTCPASKDCYSYDTCTFNFANTAQYPSYYTNCRDNQNTAIADTCGPGTEVMYLGTCIASDPNGTIVPAVPYCLYPLPPGFYGHNGGNLSCSDYSGCMVANAKYSDCLTSSGQEATCGQAGTQALLNNSWTCTDSSGSSTDGNGNPIPQSYCNPGPAQSLQCTGTSGCTYTPYQVQYSACSSECGAGTETLQSFQCEDQNMNQVPAGDCTAPASPINCMGTTNCSQAYYVPTIITEGDCEKSTSGQCGAASSRQVLTWQCEEYVGNQLVNANADPSNCAGPPQGDYCPDEDACYTWSAGQAVYTSVPGSTCYQKGNKLSLQNYNCYQSNNQFGTVLVGNVNPYAPSPAVQQYYPGCAPAAMGGDVKIPLCAAGGPSAGQ